MSTVSVSTSIRYVTIAGLLASVFTFAWLTAYASATEKEPLSIKDISSKSLKTGGLLYDNWAKLTGIEPKGTHVLYPNEGKKKGTASHRCKECHGWDYLGRDGRYSKGSHYTGIAGLMEAAKKDPADILLTLKGKSVKGHDFSGYLRSSELVALALFVKNGVKDTGSYLDAEGKGKGDANNGKLLYEKHCAKCHGADGNKLDFKPKKDGIQGVGWLFNFNPEESLHKIRFGHPGSDMPSMEVDAGLSTEHSADILTYGQNLK